MRCPRFKSREEVINKLRNLGLYDKFVQLYGRTPEEYFKEYANKEPDVWIWIFNDLGVEFLS